MFHPLTKKPPQLLATLLGKDLLDIAPIRVAPSILHDEFLEALPKDLIAHFRTQLMEDHGRLLIADRIVPFIALLPELRDRIVLIGRHIEVVALHHLPTLISGLLTITC